NQIREKIGVMFGNPETTPGGKALKFYASVRVDIRRIGAIKAASGEVLGNRTKIKLVKNKVAPPFTEAEFDIMYNEGISKTGSLLDLAIEQGIVEKKGAWISFEGNHIGQGRDAAKEELKKNPALYDKIEKLVLEKLSPDSQSDDLPAQEDASVKSEKSEKSEKPDKVEKAEKPEGKSSKK
ncbi:MAG: DNA recombination/repair protein RecA, partial [Candidatus Methylacidiphilales bacterium]